MNRNSNYYEDNKVENNNNINTYIKDKNIKKSPIFRCNIDDNKDNEYDNSNLNDNNN